MLRFHHIPAWVSKCFPSVLWRIPTKDKVLYLTFDDGPTPELSAYILSQLNEYQAKATFFCVGNNIEKHPEIYQSLLEAGHTIGNHTHHHKNGFFSSTNDYISDVYQASKLMDTNLFRPPYGKITPSQLKRLQKMEFKTILWSFLTYDFDPFTDFENVFHNMKSKLKAGDIIVLHDNIKATKGLTFLLPKILKHFHNLGYRFESLTPNLLSN